MNPLSLTWRQNRRPLLLYSYVCGASSTRANNYAMSQVPSSDILWGNVQMESWGKRSNCSVMDVVAFRNSVWCIQSSHDGTKPWTLTIEKRPGTINWLRMPAMSLNAVTVLPYYYHGIQERRFGEQKITQIAREGVTAYNIA
ncbi:hypothetical protein ACMFMG_003534 [Clarireedia jacksonii]